TTARLVPARAQLSADYGGSIAQRNAALRRAAAGLSPRDAIAPWTEQVAVLGAALVSARRETLSLVAPGFAERAGELGLAEASLRYEAEAPTVAALEARLERDLDRGVTGLGPHLDDVAILAGGRDLRSFGSQGAQRLAVRARPCPPAHPRRPRRRRRPGARDGDRRRHASRRARPARGGEPWNRSVTSSGGSSAATARTRRSATCSLPGRTPSARRSPATRSPPASSATARSSCTPATRSGPSSCSSAPRRSASGCRRRPRSSSFPGPCRSRAASLRRRPRRGRPPLPWRRGRAPPRSPPGSRIRSCGS